MHHVTLDLFRQSYFWLKRNAAAGIDGVTWRGYGDGLEENLSDLHDRVHRGAYRALPSRRRMIPKPDGRKRPLGIASLEDKIVQRAIVEVKYGGLDVSDPMRLKELEDENTRMRRVIANLTLENDAMKELATKHSWGLHGAKKR